jgi:phosphatidylinositol glycan class V
MPSRLVCPFQGVRGVVDHCSYQQKYYAAGNQFFMMTLLDYAHPLRSLSYIFLAWKTFLFAIALGSGVSPAYDTSSTLLSNDRATYHESPFDLATRLTRWDAIYFIQAARRGYLFEQEWAFASGLPVVISFLRKGMPLTHVYKWILIID